MACPKTLHVKRADTLANRIVARTKPEIGCLEVRGFSREPRREHMPEGMANGQPIPGHSATSISQWK